MVSQHTILLGLPSLAIQFIAVIAPSGSSILAIESPIRHGLLTTRSIFIPTSPPENRLSSSLGFPSSLVAPELPSASLLGAGKTQRTCGGLKLPAPMQFSRVDWEWGIIDCRFLLKVQGEACWCCSEKGSGQDDSDSRWNFFGWMTFWRTELPFQH